MATSGSDQLPTVLLDRLGSFSNFHIRKLALAETLTLLEHLVEEGRAGRVDGDVVSYYAVWKLMQIGTEEHKRLLETARGERPADLFVRGGTIANVYSGELHEGNVAVVGNYIAYVGKSEHAIGPGTVVIDASGMTVAPGYVEAHSLTRGSSITP